MQAFRATLEETVNATLLLHVTDCSAEERDSNVAAVDEVLEEIGGDKLPVLHVYNKVDNLDQPPRIERDEHGQPWRVWISAQTGDGFDLLFEAIAERLAAGWVDCWVRLPASAGRLRARLHEAGEVLEEQTATDGSMLLRINVNRVHFERLLREQGLKEEELVIPAPAVAGDDTPSYNSERSSNASHH